MVRLDAVTRPGGAHIELKPAPVLRCAFAESVAGWLRDEAAPRVEKQGSILRAVETYDAYECRGRNRVPGAKLSEHGKGNAVDLRSFILADGRVVTLTDVKVATDFRVELRDSACHRFTRFLDRVRTAPTRRIYMSILSNGAAIACASGTCVRRRRRKSSRGFRCLHPDRVLIAQPRLEKCDCCRVKQNGACGRRFQFN